MIGFLSWVTGVIIRAVIVHVWILSFHPWVLLEVWFSSWSAGMWTWSVWVLPWRSVEWSWVWSTAISWLISRRTSMCGWSAIWLKWHVMVRLMAVASIGGAQLSWAAPILAVSFLVLWPWTASVRIAMTQPVMFSKMRLWSVLASPVSFLTVVSWTWSGMGTFGRFVMNCWDSWRRYLVWTIHDNVTIFVTLVASNMRAILCYMSLFLALETNLPHVTSCWLWKVG